jgi:hypothetical protein
MDSFVAEVFGDGLTRDVADGVVFADYCFVELESAEVRAEKNDAARRDVRG